MIMGDLYWLVQDAADSLHFPIIFSPYRETFFSAGQSPRGAAESEVRGRTICVFCPILNNQLSIQYILS